MEEKYKLFCKDVQSIQHIVDEFIKQNAHMMTAREKEYPAILQAVADGMCWDDAIVTDGEVTYYTHG